MVVCSGITQRGTSCRRTVSNGTYCYQHIDQYSNKMERKVCSGVTKKGVPCSRVVLNGTCCYQHVELRVEENKIENNQYEECIICVEKNTPTHCEKCRFTFCVSCYARMGKCPQCRHVYNRRVDTATRASINGELTRDYLSAQRNAQRGPRISLPPVELIRTGTINTLIRQIDRILSSLRR